MVATFPSIPPLYQLALKSLNAVYHPAPKGCIIPMARELEPLAAQALEAEFGYPLLMTGYVLDTYLYLLPANVRKIDRNTRNRTGMERNCSDPLTSSKPR